MDTVKFDVVIQGPFEEITSRVIETYKNLTFVNKIIYSTWEDQKDIIFTNYGKKVKVLYNKDVEIPGLHNLNRVQKAIKEGLKYVESDFVLRARCEMLWSEKTLNDCYKFFLENYNKNLIKKIDGTYPKSKIFCLGLNTKWPFGNNGIWPFGVRDLMFWSDKKEIYELYDFPLNDEVMIGKYGDYTKHMRAETYLASHYYAKYDERIKYFTENKEISLYDHSKHNAEAHELYLKYSTKVFKPFSSKNIECYWPKKQKIGNYSFSDTIKDFGIIVNENDPYL